jgi:hypothetical protein
MNPVKKPLFTQEDLGINPCVSSLKISVYEREIKNELEKQSDGSYLPKKILFESTPKTSVYTTTEHRKIISNCSSASRDLFLWLLYETHTKEDYIWINKDRYMKEWGVSLNTYKKALNGLIRYALLVRTIVSGVYWINPEFFFKGSRIEKYPKNIVKTNLILD